MDEENGAKICIFGHLRFRINDIIYNNSRCYLLRGLTFNEQEALGENAKNSVSTFMFPLQTYLNKT